MITEQDYHKPGCEGLRRKRRRTEDAGGEEGEPENRGSWGRGEREERWMLGREDKREQEMLGEKRERRSAEDAGDNDVEIRRMKNCNQSKDEKQRKEERRK